MATAEKTPSRSLFQQPHPVVRRYVQLWVHRKMWPQLEASVRAYMRWKLPHTERDRRRELEKTFASVTYYAEKAESWNLPAAKLLFNISLHLLLAERDMQAVKIDALTHPNEWNRKLAARVIVLTIVEWDTDKVAGQDLRQALDDLEAPEEIRKDIVNALRLLRRTRERALSKFLDLRNKTIAHRDPDAMLVYRAIRDLRIKDVTDVAGDFYVGVNTFMAAQSKLMLHSNSLNVILCQWQATQAAAESSAPSSAT